MDSEAFFINDIKVTREEFERHHGMKAEELFSKFHSIKEQNMIQPDNMTDKYFMNREIAYDPKAKIGDQVKVLPDTLVFGGDPFEEAALGITPIYVLLEAQCPVNGVFPAEAFYIQRPDGSVIYGIKWQSGETSYG